MNSLIYWFAFFARYIKNILVSQFYFFKVKKDKCSQNKKNGLK